jgi:hypothetical protein
VNKMPMATGMVLWKTIHRGPGFPPVPVAQDGCPNHEHRQRSQHERRPEYGADPYFARRLRVRAGEDSSQDGYYGDHGLRQRGADGGKHTAHATLAEAQPVAQDLDSVGEQVSRDEYGGQRNDQIYRRQLAFPLVFILRPQSRTR